MAKTRKNFGNFWVDLRTPVFKGRKRSNLTECPLCDSPRSMFGPLTTLHRTWTSPFALQPSLNKHDNASWLSCGSASAYCGVRPVCHVPRCDGRSPNRLGWSSFIPRPFQHLPDKGKSKISLRYFLPAT
jgi:hypothetical protein